MDLDLPGNENGDSLSRDEARKRMKKPLPDLSSLYPDNDVDSIDASSEKTKPSFKKSGRKERVEKSSQRDTPYILPPRLEAFLPQEINRKLKTVKPGRGTLLNALDRLRSLLYIISTFLPGHLVQEKMMRPAAGEVTGSILRGTLLFSDVSGFTALSERLADLGLEGAERLTIMMNQYFSRMLEILSWSGGILIKFAGDATLVYFPEQEDGGHVMWAVRAGLRMFRAMKEFEKIETPTESVSLGMKIGIGSGEFIAASVGSLERMEYVIFGKTVHETMACESAASGVNQLIIDQHSLPFLKDRMKIVEHTPGFYKIDVLHDDIDDFEIKAERRRARGVIALDASPQAIIEEMSTVLNQIEALTPYLAGELINRLVVQGRKRRIESEFRPTTVLFCNFIGLDHLLNIWTGERGIKRISEILSDYFESMNKTISRFGGIVSRIDPYKDGMKMLVLFGAPVAHEDDTQRAVSASLAMNEELSSLNERWQKKYARFMPQKMQANFIEHRVGITYGTTFAGQVGSSTRCEYTVMGDDVNLAARLMGAAEMGQVLVNENVNITVADYFQFTELPPIKVKGKSRPIVIFQVDGARDDTLISRANRREFIAGRKEELEKARSVLNNAVRHHCCQLIIQGPAGIGKSHFADYIILEAIEKGAKVFPVQCQSYASGNPYAVWRLLIRNMAGILSSDSTHIQEQKLTKLFDEMDISEEDGIELADLSGIAYIPIDKFSSAKKKDQSDWQDEPSGVMIYRKSGKWRRRGSTLDLLNQLDEEMDVLRDDSYRKGIIGLSAREKNLLQKALLCFLQKISEEIPLVVFFEDAHWMDCESRDLLYFLVQNLSHASCLFLLVQREINTKTSPSQVVMNLEPFRLEGTKELIAQILVSDLAPLIQDQSNGNPLFIEQMTRWLKRTRKINSDDLQNILQSSNILQELVLSSAESLPEMQQEIVKVASVIGYEFRYSEIRHLLSDDVEPATLNAYLRALIEAQLISLSEAGIDSKYVYQQSLVRDILYKNIPFERRKELHLVLAKYLSSNVSQRQKLQNRIEALFDNQTSEKELLDAERIANHFEMAEYYQEAVESYLEAADIAWKNQTLVKAQDLYIKVLDIIEKNQLIDTKINILELHQQTIISLGDIQFAACAYQAALDQYEKAIIVDKDVVSNLLTAKRAMLLTVLKRYEEALDLMNKFAGEEWMQLDLPCLMIYTWFLWRSGRNNLKTFIQQIDTFILEDIKGEWFEGIKALVSEFKGNWETAVEQYLSLGKIHAAAQAAFRAGEDYKSKDCLLEAKNWYHRAVSLMQLELADGFICAMMMIHEANVLLKLSEMEKAKKQLESAADILNMEKSKKNQSVLTFIDHTLSNIEHTQEIIYSGWDWKVADDEIKLSLLFPR